MENTFNRLITRSQPTKTTTEGDPWEILPIKNKKNANSCTEVHLAKRGIDKLTRFEDFPNLEVIWLNENKVSVTPAGSLESRSAETEQLERRNRLRRRGMS